MKSQILSLVATTSLLMVSFATQAATVTVDNFSDGGGAYGVRDASGAFITDGGYRGAIGKFSITDSAIQTSFSGGDVAAVSAGFQVFGSEFSQAVIPGAFQQDAVNAYPSSFSGTEYLVLYKGSSLATATELLIAKLLSTFPTDTSPLPAVTGFAQLRPSNVATLLVGSTGAAFDFGGTDGALPSFQMALVTASPEPSRAMLAGLGLMGLVIRRRRK